MNLKVILLDIKKFIRNIGYYNFFKCVWVKFHNFIK